MMSIDHGFEAHVTSVTGEVTADSITTQPFTPVKITNHHLSKQSPVLTCLEVPTVNSILECTTANICTERGRYYYTVRISNRR